MSKINIHNDKISLLAAFFCFYFLCNFNELIESNLFQTSCILSFFNKTDENIIISARLPDEPNVDPAKLFDKEKVNNIIILNSMKLLHLKTFLILFFRLNA